MHPRPQSLVTRVCTNGLAFRPLQPSHRTYAISTADSTPIAAVPLEAVSESSLASTSTVAVKNPFQRRRGGDLGVHLPKHVIPKDAYIPAYPYGDYQLFKQGNKGLYGEQMIQFGNNVSRKTETKTRRYWKPNVLSKSLYSIALKKRIKLRITSKVLKTIDREGGLDEYLLKDNERRVKELGPLGWALRWTLMQKPEVITRLRAEAAALGLDQATIDEQWPTAALKAQRKAEQALMAPQNDALAETEDQEMWAPEEEDEVDSELGAPVVSQQERKAAAQAASEYTRAVKAAQRYLSRGVVDSEEEGLKLAFIRAKERQEAASRLRRNFTKKIVEQFTAEEAQEVRDRLNLPTIKDRTARRIAYNQWRREQIEQAGSYEAWKAASDPEKATARAAMLEEAGGLEAWQAVRKLKYASLISDAETASTNDTLDIETKVYYANAIDKADRAIRARHSGGEDAYVELTLEDLSLSQPSSEAGSDAWAALVSSSKASPQRELNA